MKKTFLLFVAGCLTLPVLAHAEDSNRKSHRKITREVAQAHPRQKMIYYMTSAPRTGSMIPMVYRQYDGRIDSASNAAVYGGSNIQTSGTQDVGATLARFDPSITFSGRR